MRKVTRGKGSRRARPGKSGLGESWTGKGPIETAVCLVGGREEGVGRQERWMVLVLKGRGGGGGVGGGTRGVRREQVAIFIKPMLCLCS